MNSTKSRQHRLAAKTMWEGLELRVNVRKRPRMRLPGAGQDCENCLVKPD